MKNRLSIVLFSIKQYQNKRTRRFFNKLSRSTVILTVLKHANTYKMNHTKPEMSKKLRSRSYGTGSVWSRPLVRSVYGHIYSYHFLYDTLFCNIITNLRVMLVLRLFKLIWWPHGSGPVWTGSNKQNLLKLYKSIVMLYVPKCEKVGLILPAFWRYSLFSKSHFECVRRWQHKLAFNNVCH